MKFFDMQLDELCPIHFTFLGVGVMTVMNFSLNMATYRHTRTYKEALVVQLLAPEKRLEPAKLSTNI
jgi:hypothetical protein